MRKWAITRPSLRAEHGCPSRQSPIAPRATRTGSVSNFSVGLRGRSMDIFMLPSSRRSGGGPPVGRAEAFKIKFRVPYRRMAGLRLSTTLALAAANTGAAHALGPNRTFEVVINMPLQLHQSRLSWIVQQFKLCDNGSVDRATLRRGASFRTLQTCLFHVLGRTA